ncbi:MAG: YtxH domain-containing protein [Rhodothermales bacterium]|nr:YtxH domain-containing protein [Rhodothermales bacterium]
MNSAGRIIVTAASTFVAGVAVGLLVSPHSGSDNRKLVTRKLREQSKRVEGQIRELEDRFADLEKSIVETGTDIAQRLKAQAKDSVQDLVSEGDGEDWSVEGKELATDLKRMPRK